MHEQEVVLEVRDLSLRLPDGKTLFEGLELTLNRGEVVAVLGGSGTGKSTLARALLEPDALRQQGMELSLGQVRVAGRLGLVPQHGAPFDHLDVAGNIGLALRHREKTGDEDPGGVSDWIEAVDLPRALARPGVDVARLSGGQAQRLAVARTLATGQRVLFLDEPSAGLDGERVKGLAALLRRQCDARGAAMVVTTHDTQLACHVADRVLLLDPAARRLVPVLEESWPGPLDPGDPDQALAWRGRLEAKVERLLQRGEAPAERARVAGRPAIGRALRGLFGAFLVPGRVIATAPGWLRNPRDLWAVLRRVLVASAIRPAPFYLVVSVLLGYTILYVAARAMPAGLQARSTVELVGGSYILALTPPICAFLFVATSGSAVNAWLGSLSLTRQIAALEAMGIPRDRYLWVPGWLGLSLSFLVAAAIFAGGMLLGGAWHSYQSGVADPWPVLLGDLLDPTPGRAVLRDRAAWLVGIYAFGVAADVVERGCRRKTDADAVTRGMTGSVVACTLWVVALELLTAVWVFRR
jgi:thiamine transport system ATP-binding protein